jgi:hypothetical protein
VWFPRFLEPDEFVAIAKSAAGSARAGREKDAEFGFRRLAASWPRYRPAIVDLSTLLMTKARRLALEGKTDVALLDEIEQALRDVLDLDPPPSRAHVVGMLSEVQLLREQVVQAQNLVRDELGLLGVDADCKQQLEDTMQRIVSRGDLYDRGIELLPVEVLTLHGQPHPVFDDAMCQRVKRGIECLIRHQEANQSSWQEA